MTNAHQGNSDLKDISALNRQMIAIETQYGAEELSGTVLRALRKTFSDRKDNPSSESIIQDISRVFQQVWDSKPKMAAVIHDVQKLLCILSEMESVTCADVIESIDHLLEARLERLQALAKEGFSVISSASSVFVCSYSSSVLEILKYTYKNGKSPKILIASKDEEETSRIASTFKSMGFSWQLIDQASLAYHIDDIDVALCGSLALTACQSLVVRAGTAGMLAQLNDADKKLYVAITTDKFTDWKRTGNAGSSEEIDSSRSPTLMLKKQKYSHDFINAKLLSGLICESGLVGRETLPALLEERQQEFRRRESIIAFRSTHENYQAVSKC